MSIADLLAQFNSAEKADDTEQLHRLRTMIIRSVHLVNRGANRREFAVRKGEEKPMLTNDIIGLDITQTAAGLVTVGKANRDSVATELTELAKKLADPDADDKDLAKAAEAIVSMLATEKAEDGDDGKKAEEDAEAEAAKAKAKKAKAEDEDEEFAEYKRDKAAKKAAKAKAAEGEEEKEDEGEVEGEEKKSDELLVSDAFAMISKAGRRMSTGRLEIFKQAMTLLRKLAEDLDPQEKKASGFLKLAKSLEGIDADAVAEAEAIKAGNAAKKVKKADDDGQPKGRTGFSFGMNINNRDMHRETADPATSFFDK